MTLPCNPTSTKTVVPQVPVRSANVNSYIGHLTTNNNNNNKPSSSSETGSKPQQRHPLWNRTNSLDDATESSIASDWERELDSEIKLLSMQADKLLDSIREATFSPVVLREEMTIDCEDVEDREGVEDSGSLFRKNFLQFPSFEEENGHNNKAFASSPSLKQNPSHKQTWAAPNRHVFDTRNMVELHHSSMDDHDDDHTVNSLLTTDTNCTDRKRLADELRQMEVHFASGQSLEVLHKKLEEEPKRQLDSSSLEDKNSTPVHSNKNNDTTAHPITVFSLPSYDFDEEDMGEKESVDFPAGTVPLLTASAVLIWSLVTCTYIFARHHILDEYGNISLFVAASYP